MKKYLAIILIITISKPVVGQIPHDSIKSIIKQEVINKRSKSIVVGIINANGRQILSEGRLSDENPALPDSNTIYEIGSITKVFTSLLLADMSLKHQLSLTDPISKYLPKSLKTPVKNGQEITLLNLSTHRAGFPRNAFNLDPKNLDNPFADYTINRLYEYVSKFEPSREINSRWEYSNIGYALLGHILSLVAQNDFDTLVNQSICKPLNMNSTFFSLPQKLRNVATGHTEYGMPTNDWDLLLAGGGGLRSNVNDLLIFVAANLGFIKTDLHPAMELCHVPQAKKDGNDGYITMGWTLRNDRGEQILWKDGGTGGYRTFLGIDIKNRFGVVVLSNSNNSVTDIGLHILDSTAAIKPYRYPWNLLDTLRAVITTNGIDAGIELYKYLKFLKDPVFVFDEEQLNYLGDGLRRNNKIKDAIKIYKLNLREYPTLPLVYESLGETYRRNNDKKTAIKYFKKAHGLEPENLHWTYLLKKLGSD